jgi:2-methylcitrate dehydratase PrpD
VLDLAAKIDLVEDPTANARFPHERWAAAQIEFSDGRSIASPSMRARGDADEPLTAAELDVKWDELVPPVLGDDEAARLRTTIDRIAHLDDISPLLDLLYRAPLTR